MSITTGMKGTATKIVTENDTAKVVKSGSLPVLATPVLSALMEEAACDAVKEGLSKVDAPILSQTPNDPQQREKQLAEFEKIKAGF